MTLAVGWQAEISRKVLHLAAAIIPLVYTLVDREVVIWLLWGCVVVAVTVEILRHGSSTFQAVFRRAVGFMVRAGEWGRICGATYVLVAALLSVWLFPRWIAIAVLLILSISDSAASLVGLRFGRQRLLGKSLAGSSAFFVTAVVILWITLPGSKGAGLAAALVATLAEALPAARLGRFELNDNLTIPLLTGLALCLAGV